MINKRNIFLMIFTIFTVNAMEVEGVCYLALLPREIHDYITSYLTFNDRESDDEFIARTRASGTITPEHLTLLKQHESDSELPGIETERSSPGTIRTYSVDCSKIISLEKLADAPKVTIFDIQNKTTQQSVQLAQPSKKNIHNLTLIALSRTGKYCAQWQVHERYNHWRTPYQESRLIIKNVLSGKVEFIRYLIAEKHKDLVCMGFNKQETKIIVHAKENSLWEHAVAQWKMSSYYIFSLTSSEEHEEKSKKTFEIYLRQIGCCKNLIG